MAFLDNSGDIILDAVLTDTGRFRLAKGDGTFRIAKFALGDDEINYESYNKNHASGSAYYDLEILQSPVFEAFTNNTSLLKSKLMSIPRTNLLYLPVMKISFNDGLAAAPLSNNPDLGFYVAVDDTTAGMPTDSVGVENAYDKARASTVQGVLAGNLPGEQGSHIEIHQGLDTDEIPRRFSMDADLVETQYILEMDNRLGHITDLGGNPTPVSFIDDDNIASYFLSMGVNNYVQVISPTADKKTTDILGPRGTSLKFKIESSIELATSTFLFTKLGSTLTNNSNTFYYIDSTVRITGATTGYRLDVPVRFIKYKA